MATPLRFSGFSGWVRLGELSLGRGQGVIQSVRCCGRGLRAQGRQRSDNLMSAQMIKTTRHDAGGCQTGIPSSQALENTVILLAPPAGFELTAPGLGITEPSHLLHFSAVLDFSW